MSGFGLLLKSEEAEKAQIISNVPGAKELLKTTEEKSGDPVLGTVLGGSDSNMAKAAVSLITPTKGPWQRAAKSPIPGQYRRRVITKDGRDKWEYYKTKSNKYKGRQPAGEGWAQVGKEDHGGYRREKKEEPVKAEAPLKNEPAKDDKQAVAPGGSSSKKKFEYKYPTKEHAESARKYHGGKLFSSDFDEAMDHLHHLHGAKSAIQDMRAKDKNKDRSQDKAKAKMTGTKASKSLGFGVSISDDSVDY